MWSKYWICGPDIMVQTSSVKLCDFFNLFRVYKWIDFALEVLSKLLSPSSRNLDPSKTAFSKFYFPTNEIDVSVTSSYVQKMTQITETKIRTCRTFWKAVFFSCSTFYQTPPKTKLWKMVPVMAYEVFVRNVSSSLHVPFPFCCEFWPKSTNTFCWFCKMQETESKNESQFYITRKILII